MTDEKPAERVEPVETAQTVTAKRTVGALSLTIAALFGLFYAYDVWEALGNLIGIPSIYRSLPTGSLAIDVEASIPWWLLITALVLPIVLYAVAFLLGLRRTVAERALLLLLGLAVSAALYLGTIGMNSLILSDLLHDLAR